MIVSLLVVMKLLMGICVRVYYVFILVVFMHTADIRLVVDGMHFLIIIPIS